MLFEFILKDNLFQRVVCFYENSKPNMPLYPPNCHVGENADGDDNFGSVEQYVE